MTLGVAAATAVSEALVYGHRPGVAAGDFLIRAKNHLDAGGDLDGFLDEVLRSGRRGTPGSGKNRAVAATPGFGRPLGALEDERIKPVMRLADELGFADGPMVRLAFGIEAALIRKRRACRMNIAALNAALTLDQGLTPRQAYHLFAPCFVGGIIPCGSDAFSQEEGSFFPLRCERIAYRGKARRSWNPGGGPAGAEPLAEPSPPTTP